MAIEPLGNIMTVQSQPVQKIEVERPVAKGMDAAAQSVGNVVDATTAVVGKIGQAGEQNDNRQGNQQQPSKEQLKQAVDKMNKNMHNSEVMFGIHEATKRITIKVVDKETKEVIRELPPEKTLDMIAKVWELAGILVDEKR